MKYFFSLSILLFLNLICFSQSFSADNYYHGRIEYVINTGKEHLARGDKEEGINSYKEAISIAKKRIHDPFSSFIVCNNYIFEPVINFYYELDSLNLAHKYLDLYFEFHDRFESKLKNDRDISIKDYWQYMANFSLRAFNEARSHRDAEYYKKFGKQYISICRDNGFISEQLLYTGIDLEAKYFEDGDYLQAIELCSYLYDVANKLGLKPIQVIGLGALSHNKGTINSLKDGEYAKYAKAKYGNDANEEWISFLEKFYKIEGEDYADSLLISIDNSGDLANEINFNNASSTYAASLMTRCNLACPLFGVSKSIQYLQEFKNYLISRKLHRLWPIVIFNFINELEYRKEYSAAQSIFRLVEEDIKDRQFSSQDQEDEFYFNYFGVSQKNADYSKWFELGMKYLPNIKESSPSYYLAQGALGNFYSMFGNFEKNLEYRLNSLEHFHKENFNESSRYIIESSLYSHIGSAYIWCHDFSNAEHYLKIALEIAKNHCNHSNQFTPLFYLGVLYLKTNRLELARNCFVETLKIQNANEDEFLKSAPLSYLFEIERRQNNIDSARRYLVQTWQNMLSQYSLNKNYFSIPEQAQYWQEYGDIQYLGGLIAESTPYYNDIYYNMLLTSKGFLLKEESEIYENVQQSRNNELIELYKKAYIQNNASLDDVNAFTSAYRKNNFIHRSIESSWEDVKNALPKNAIAIEFFEYGIDSVSFYGALVVHPNSSRPSFVKLCASDDLQKALKLRDKVYQESRLLYDLIWRPLTSEVKKAKRIYISPYKDLFYINFGAIQNSNGSTLNDSFEIYRVSSTQNITNIQNPLISSAYLYGGLVYDSNESDMLREHQKYANINEKKSWQVDTTLRSGWSYLPSTLIETKNIKSILSTKNISVTNYEGITGTEESFKAINGCHPGLLHLATHGFYLQYHFADSTLVVDNAKKRIETSFKAMTRSGIIFSNGGRAWKGLPIPAESEDGILQADEISNLDLSGTSLLVLSACETALGDNTEDGIYGLQRAFKQAGVGTIIMSLWEVNDEATSMFMTYFYSNWIKCNNKHDAFIYAQNKLRKHFSDPFYWASFIMLD